MEKLSTENLKENSKEQVIKTIVDLAKDQKFFSLNIHTEKVNEYSASEMAQNRNQHIEDRTDEAWTERDGYNVTFHFNINSSKEKIYDGALKAFEDLELSLLELKHDMESPNEVKRTKAYLSSEATNINFNSYIIR